MPLQLVVAQTAGVVLQGFAGALFLKWGAWQMTTTTEVSDSLERVDSIINMLDEICDHMDGFSRAFFRPPDRSGYIGRSSWPSKPRTRGRSTATLPPWKSILPLVRPHR